MLIDKRQLAASILMAQHMIDREPIAAFVSSVATAVAAHNPFSQTSVGAQRHIWGRYYLEFKLSQIASLGLPCLLKSLHTLRIDEPLVQQILQAGACRAYVYHQGDGCRIVGSVLHAKANMALPVIEPLPRLRQRKTRQAPLQLDLFAIPFEGAGSYAAGAGGT